MVLVDTSVWIDVFRKPARLQLEDHVDFDEVVTCLVVIQEVLQDFDREADFRRAHPEVEVEFRQYQRDEDFLREDVDLWIALKQKPRQQWPRPLPQ